MTWDKVWEDIFASRPWGKYPGEDLIRFVARNFYQSTNRKEIKLLEVGCGTGSNLWFMAREGFTVYGVDGSISAINIAQQRLDEEIPGWSGQLAVQDIMKLPFPDEYFDAVIDNEAIYCNTFEDSKAIYTEIARVTRKSGKLFSRTFATGCWGDGEGVPSGYNAWYANSGPLQDKGLSRFTSIDDIPQLIENFEITETELITRTMEDQQRVIKEWIITGIKKQ